MKNEIEYFIKYLDDQLSAEEKLLFENRLLNNNELKNKFDIFTETVNSSKIEIKVDERYFSTIIPLAKKRLEFEKRPSILFKLSYLVPVILIGFFFLLKSSNYDNKNTFYDFQNLLEHFTNEEELTEELLISIFELHNNFNIDGMVFPDLYEESSELDETVFEYLEENLDISEINYSLINQLTDNEFNIIYEELLDKKIL